MSYSLIHHGRDKIVLNGREYAFSDFLKVCGDYCVPWGFPTRIYESGKQHCVTDGSNLVYLSKTDAACDRWCSQEPELAMLVMRLRAENRE